jgi:peptidoglycan/LPS O-acetylase OafA/YrhL
MMPATPPRELSPNLDLLRAVAVASVFCAHLLTAATKDRSLGSLGRFGVILFFLHTSLVLMASLQRLERTAPGYLSLALAFWVRRVFRIYPLSILLVALVALLHVPNTPDDNYFWIGWKALLANAALVQNLTKKPDILAVLWSLPLEMQMYILLPFAFLVIRGSRRYRSLALWVISVVLACTLPRVDSRLGVFNFAPCFAAGIVAFDLARSRTSKWKLPAWVWPAGILTAIAIFGPHDDVSITQKYNRAWVLSILLGVLYANVKEGRSNGIHTIYRWIAEHSYGIYLSHSVVFWLVFYRMDQFPPWMRAATLAICTVGIPALLYVSIEKPFVLAGGHIARRILMRATVSKHPQPSQACP